MIVVNLSTSEKITEQEVKREKVFRKSESRA